MSNVPIIILREGSEDTAEKEARKQNISAMMAVSETVKSTLGPKGMSKMLVDTMGDSTITNDGAEILQSLDLENVAALMMVNLAKAVDEEIGDGTTSSVIFTAKLLENALELTDQSVHPKHITHGYKLAASKAVEILDEISEEISVDDEKVLKDIAMTAMNSEDVATARAPLAELALKAVKQISEGENTFSKISNIKIIKAVGKSLTDSELINGVYLKKEKVNTVMPDVIKNARIAVIRAKLDVVKTEFDAQIQIKSADMIQKFLDNEDKMLQDKLKVFKDLGINFIVNNQDISDKFGGLLAKEGIAAIKNLGDTDINSILKAIGATRVDDLSGLKEEDLGFADLVEFKKIDKDWYTQFTGCKNPKSVSIVIKGGIDKILSTAEIAMNDVLSVVSKVYDTKKVVGGGGAVYIELAKRLREYAQEVSGKEQLAITTFALALEEIPRTLMRNAGLEEIERMTELVAAHKTDADKWIGIDTITNTIGNNFERGIVEPAALIKTIVKSGTELATMILRVDRMISAKGSGGGGMPPGMGGMGGGGMPPGMM